MAAITLIFVYAGVFNTFTVSPNSIILQPKETTAIVSITVIDDLLPENDLSSTISADSVAGSEQINIIIVDNDCECTCPATRNIMHTYKFIARTVIKILKVFS